MDTFLNRAIEAAKLAGEIQRDYFSKGVEVKIKGGEHHNRVTIADLESEKAIVSLIKKHYPEHNILAEEGKYKTTDSEYKWVIDPLDGTNNFSRGISIFCVSIALAKNDEVILGVIYDVLKDELFTAEKGKGAFLNGKKITVSHNNKWSDCLLVTGFYYDRGQAMMKNLDIIRKFFLAGVLGIRRFGSAALDLCYVACGRLDGYWEFELNPWDFSAGKCILEEAGGKITDENGENLPIGLSYIVASNEKIHHNMLKILK